MKPPYKVICFLGVFVLNILCGHPDCTNVTNDVSACSCIDEAATEREACAISYERTRGWALRNTSFIYGLNCVFVKRRREKRVRILGRLLYSSH